MTYRPTGPALSVGPTAIQYKIVVLIFKVHSISTPVYLSDGYRGGREGGMVPPPRNPSPNFAVAKVCRI